MNGLQNIRQGLPIVRQRASRSRKGAMAIPLVGALTFVAAACGPTAPAGAEFRKHCEPVAAEGDVEICMEQMSRVYRGPDSDRNKDNAAAQWARDYYGDSGRPD